MLHNRDHILTTHVGSLPRPSDLLDMMQAKLLGTSFDCDVYDERLRLAVKDVVRQQMENGIEIVTDGELSKPGFFVYVRERLAGFKETGPGPGPSTLPPRPRHFRNTRRLFQARDGR